MIEKIIEKNNINIDGFFLTIPIYEKYGKSVAWFSNGRIDMFIIFKDDKLIDIQID